MPKLTIKDFKTTEDYIDVTSYMGISMQGITYIRCVEKGMRDTSACVRLNEDTAKDLVKFLFEQYGWKAITYMNEPQFTVTK